MKDFEYEGGWRKLLVESGEIYRLDWPDTLSDPNVKPRIASIQNAAFVASFRCAFGASKSSNAGYELPDLEWLDADNEEIVLQLQLMPVTQQSHIALNQKDFIPPQSVFINTTNGELMKKRLVYIGTLLSKTNFVSSTKIDFKLIDYLALPGYVAR